METACEAVQQQRRRVLRRPRCPLLSARCRINQAVPGPVLQRSPVGQGRQLTRAWRGKQHRRANPDQ